MADGTPSNADERRPLWLVVSALGVAQIISWGTLYYSLTVLSASIERELGFTKLVTFGAFTLGLLASGAIAPGIGRRIDREGGRRTMSAGSIVAAMALLVLATSSEPVLYTAGWILAGVAMGATLYDAVFASIFQIAGDRYRKAVTGLTLFGGFASTVFWPLSHALDDAIGWRWTLVTYASLHLAFCLPVHRRMLRTAHGPELHSKRPATSSSYTTDARFRWLAASFACVTLVFSALSAFIIVALTSRGFSPETAVWIAALIGPMQVLARAIEWVVAPRVSAIAVGTVACLLSLISTMLLASVPGMLVFGLAFAICYGASNGILTIARGAVPIELFGKERQGEMLGALARPSFFTKAFAPAVFAGGISLGISLEILLYALSVVSAAAVGCYYLATRARPTASVLSAGVDRGT